MANTIYGRPLRQPRASTQDDDKGSNDNVTRLSVEIAGVTDGAEYADVAEHEGSGMFDAPARKVAVGIALLMLLLVVSTLVWLIGSRPTPTGSGKAASVGLPTETAPRTGAFAPDFELLDVRTNQPLRLSTLRGKPVFINFWGTWCPPCRAEMPEMQKLRNKYGDELQIMGISMAPRDDPNGVKGFVEQFKYDWTFVHDPDNNVTLAYQVSAVPSSFFIDKDGVIRAVHIGGMNFDQMEQYTQKVR